MKIMTAIVLALSLVISSNVSARVWYVKPDSTGQAINIQAGIDSCAACDTVLVSPGMFRGDGNREIDFRGKEILVISECRFDTTITNPTIIDCEGTYPNSFHRGFYFHSGETSASILEGFVIENGGADWPGGGGIFCDSVSSPSIRYNTVRYCRANAGPAIYCLNSSPLIEHNKFFSNGSTKDLGTAIECESSSAVIRNNEIYGNSAGRKIMSNEECSALSPTINCDFGGILCNSCSLVTIESNDICGNEFGAIGLIGSTGIIHNNRIANNGAGECGNEGGIGCYSSNVEITDNEIAGNYSWYVSAIGSYGSTVIIDNNYIHDNWDGRGMGPCQIICCVSGSICVISNNTISDNRRCSAIISCSSDSLEITNNKIINNSLSNEMGGGSAIVCCSPNSIIKSNVIALNLMGFESGVLALNAISCYSLSPLIENNTITRNEFTNGYGIYVGSGSSPVISNNIICDNYISDDCYYECYAGGIYVADSTASISCNDIFNNESANYTGIPDQTGINGNMSVDPIFCYPDIGEFCLHQQSPCLPGNNPYGSDCGLIGALAEGCEYIATLLQGFDAAINESAITIIWILQEHDDGAAFHVFRAYFPGGKYVELGNSLIKEEGLIFKYDDNDCEPGTSYRYRVDVEDRDGRRILFETDPVSLPELPLALYQNYPNPFNPTTTIRYYLPERRPVHLGIYNIAGMLVSSLATEEREKGFHTAQWHGTDRSGNPAASGVYFYRLTVGKERRSRKLILLR